MGQKRRRHPILLESLEVFKQALFASDLLNNIAGANKFYSVGNPYMSSIVGQASKAAPSLGNTVECEQDLID